MQNVYKFIYVIYFVYMLLSVLKIYNICNMNYKLTVELQSTYRITTLKISFKRDYTLVLYINQM